MQKYHIQKGPDGIRWVSIEPLIEAVKDAIDQVMVIDISKGNLDQKQIVEFKLMGLRQISEFLSALLTEHTLMEARENYEKGRNPDSGGLITSPITRSH